MTTTQENFDRIGAHFRLCGGCSGGPPVYPCDCPRCAGYRAALESLDALRENCRRLEEENAHLKAEK